MKLVLVRHGESTWNELNLFTGWTDVDLSEKGHNEAIGAGKVLKENGYSFDIAYTSYLRRAIHTLDHILTQMDLCYIPTCKTWKLNERHYGALQGLNKAETAKKYGEEQVQVWRRSFDVLPPALDDDDKRNPSNDLMYSKVNREELPNCESLKTTIERVVPFFEEAIKKDMEANKKVIVVAHGNSIRALIKYFEQLSDEEIVSVNIPTGVPLVYEFDEQFNVINHSYLADKGQLEDKMNAIKNQGKIKENAE